MHKTNKWKLVLGALAVGAACLVGTQPAKADIGITIGGRRGGVSFFAGNSYYYSPYVYRSYSYGIPVVPSYGTYYYSRPIYRSYYHYPHIHYRHYHHGHHHHRHHHHGHHHHHHHHRH